jgi:hypothetical protein
LTEKSTPAKPILGYTDRETVKLDFDNTSFKIVKYWSEKAMIRFRLGGYLILKSSRKNFHVVFDRRVSWSRNMKIVAWVSFASKNPGLLQFLCMQCIKGSSILRVSSKRQKPSPQIVFRYGPQDGEIRNYLEYYRMLNHISRLADSVQSLTLLVDKERNEGCD